MEASTAKKRETARRIIDNLIDLLSNRPVAFWNAVPAWDFADIEKRLEAAFKKAAEGEYKYRGIGKSGPQHPADSAEGSDDENIEETSPPTFA